jgi:hypothetical protein
MEQLKAESRILKYTAPGPMFGGPPEMYDVRFHGRGLWKPDGGDRILVRDQHEVLVRLGASYPRMMPELVWKTPIFHPNISSNGVVCLGGYSTHWVPSLQLDELCTMLWDMIRYANYDVDSPYNRAAAQWAKTQETFQFPLDPRPLRDNTAEDSYEVDGVDEATGLSRSPVATHTGRAIADPTARTSPGAAAEADILFVDDIEIVDAELVSHDPTSGERGGAEIIYID